MVESSTQPTVIGPSEGDLLDFEGSDMYIKFDGTDTDQGFYVAHEIIEPRTLAAPLHYHHNENEYFHVVEGRLGVMLGDEVVEAEAGTWVFKPRQQWHTYWNPGDTSCHIILVVTPAGVENYLREIVELFGSDEEQLARLTEQYELEMDFESIPELSERFGLSFAEG